MDYSHIEAFLTIVNTHSLSRAAEMLYISQSTISHRLSTLEKELNVILIIRRKGYRTIELTSAGEQFVPIAHRWKSLWDETMKLEHIEPTISLNIGGVDSVNTYFLCSFYIELKKKMPLLNLTIHLCNNSPQVYTLLENRDIDIGFVTIPAWNKNIILEPILSEQFKIVYYAMNRLMPESITPSELEPKYELFQPWGPEYHQWHDYWWPTSQKPYISFDATGMMREFLKSDDKYWTIVPESILRKFQESEGFYSSNIISPPPNHIGYMAVHRYPKDYSVQGIKHLKKYLRKFLANNDLAYRK